MSPSRLPRLMSRPASPLHTMRSTTATGRASSGQSSRRRPSLRPCGWCHEPVSRRPAGRATSGPDSSTLASTRHDLALSLDAAALPAERLARSASRMAARPRTGAATAQYADRRRNSFDCVRDTLTRGPHPPRYEVLHSSSTRVLGTPASAVGAIEASDACQGDAHLRPARLRQDHLACRLASGLCLGRPDPCVGVPRRD